MLLPQSTKMTSSSFFTIAMEFKTLYMIINLWFILPIFHLCLCSAMDTITSAQSIRDQSDHDETTVSSNSSDFKLGFFSPQDSKLRYVGIWYLNHSNVIWVANRNHGLSDHSGVVTISKDGNLVILNEHNYSIWSSNVSNSIAANSTAKLLDTGNFVLIDNNTGEIIWESFQHPSDFLLSKMKLSINRVTGQKVKLTSWKSLSDPSVGYYSASLERPDAPEIYLRINGTKPYYRTGPWNGRTFMGFPYGSNYLSGWSVESENDGTVYVTYNFADDSDFAVVGLTPQRHLLLAYWHNKREVFRRVYNGTSCEPYGTCGAFGSCDLQSSPICSCLSGYEPKNVEEWNKQNWSGGCVRRIPLKCAEGKEDRFLKLENVKVPDFVVRTSNVEDNCRTQCLKNCSCVAYSYDLNGIGCMHWGGELIDIQKFAIGGVDLYIRVPYEEFGTAEKHSHKRRTISIVVTLGLITLASLAIGAYLSWKLTAGRPGETPFAGSQTEATIGHTEQVKLDELPVFDFEVIATATNNFHPTNMLGKGGFGLVYKGQLQDGQEIAVKRLSLASRQGQEEFMNEVAVISKLQHRNLVRLLGCCIEQGEKILIYEYMPNKSLDAILFDPVRKKELDWEKRFKIIEGISRGLLYLHRDSRLKIIHRDLKAGNILLDEELTPKISDFGMARIFGGSEEEGNTERVVGTYGYMSPEYAILGLFSEKSDGFSFGVLLLEIVSGRSSTKFLKDEESQTLIGYAWKLWKEDNYDLFVDQEMHLQQGYRKDILRCIHIGLLCVQESAIERPSMATVVSMVNSEIVDLPLPKEPSYIVNQKWLCSNELASEVKSLYSTNNVTITNLTAR